MVLEHSKSFLHSPCGTPKNHYSEQEVHDIVKDLLAKCGVSANEVAVSKDGEMTLECRNDIRLHTVMLEAEKLGLTIKYTKKTVIEVYSDYQEQAAGVRAMEATAN